MLADCADRLVQIFAKKRADDLRMLFNRAFLPLGHDLIQPARALHLQPHLTEHTDDALAAGVFDKRGMEQIVQLILLAGIRFGSRTDKPRVNVLQRLRLLFVQPAGFGEKPDRFGFQRAANVNDVYNIVQLDRRHQ